VLATEGGDALVVTTDTLVEGVHFRREEGVDRIGRKAMAVSLSDVAAMGCAPRFAFVAAGLGPGTTPEDARSLVAAMGEIAERFGTVLCGGDVVDSPGGLTLTTTVLGAGRLDRVVRRSGARVGDRVLVTGRLGGSLRGRHLDFTPRVDEATALVAGFEIHAMIDLSDGLSTDLHHLLDESGVGARIRAGSVPVSDAAHAAAETSGRSALDHALDDGEDFELLFTAAPDTAERLLAAPPFATPLADVGEIRPADEGCFLVNDDGEERELRAGGHEHLRG
jgi:thiamine-monophosphate kinase